MIEIRAEHLHDVPARERLLDACFPGNRRAKTSERLREGRLPARGLAFSATRRGRLVGTLRLWHVETGDAQVVVTEGTRRTVARAASRSPWTVRRPGCAAHPWKPPPS